MGDRKIHSSAQDGSPRLSVMVPTYRPDELLLETLTSLQAALVVAGVPAQVEIVDDCSPDVDVQAVVRGWVACGALTPVSVYRRPANGGLGQCWNTCIERARGEYLHILHQDDLIAPEFYRRLLDAGRRYPQAAMLYCRTIFREGSADRLDAIEQPEEGLLEDWLSRICTSQRLQCPSVLVRTAAYARLGGFDPALRYIIDWEMWIRIAASEEVAYVPEALAIYRVHAGAETRRIKASGVVTMDAARGLVRIRQTLNDARRMDCYPLAASFCSVISGFAAYEAECAGEWRTAAHERLLAMRHFGTLTRPRILWSQLRSYARAQARRLRHSRIREAR